MLLIATALLVGMLLIATALLVGMLLISTGLLVGMLLESRKDGVDVDDWKAKFNGFSVVLS
jgi:hypothetical protein